MIERPELRDGFALPAALLALIVVGGLVTAGAYAAMVEDRSSSNVDFGQKAFVAAEMGIQYVLGTRTRPYFEAIATIGDSDVIGPEAITVGDVDAQYTVTITRLGPQLFMAESQGEILTGGRYAGAKRRVAELMRIHTTKLPLDRAYTTQAAVRIRGQSFISGEDDHRGNWTECTKTGTQKSVVTNDINTVDVPPGEGGNTGLIGPHEEQPLTLKDFLEFGDMHVEDLIEYANHSFYGDQTFGAELGPAYNGDGTCDGSVGTNWGAPDSDPSDGCHYYWPIIYVDGDLSIASSKKGQGILIVDGNLSISGGFEYNGIVFVYGNIKTSGTGNKVMGSVNILGEGGHSELSTTGVGDSQIHLSTCAIERAHLYNDRFARPMLLSNRSFVDLSGVGVN